jgi:hypothetical protein
MEASKELKQKYGEYGEIKVRGNGMYEFVLKKIPSTIHTDDDKTKQIKTQTKKSKTTHNKTKKNR